MKPDQLASRRRDEFDALPRMAQFVLSAAYLRSLARLPSTSREIGEACIAIVDATEDLAASPLGDEEYSSAADAVNRAAGKLAVAATSSERVDAVARSLLSVGRRVAKAAIDDTMDRFVTNAADESLFVAIDLAHSVLEAAEPRVLSATDQAWQLLLTKSREESWTDDTPVSLRAFRPNMPPSVDDAS